MIYLFSEKMVNSLDCVKLPPRDGRRVCVKRGLANHKDRSFFTGENIEDLDGNTTNRFPHMFTFTWDNETRRYLLDNAFVLWRPRCVANTERILSKRDFTKSPLSGYDICSLILGVGLNSKGSGMNVMTTNTCEANLVNANEPFICFLTKEDQDDIKSFYNNFFGLKEGVEEKAVERFIQPFKIKDFDSCRMRQINLE